MKKPEPPPKKKILVTDDEAHIRRLASIFLRDTMGEVIIFEAQNGEEALRIAAEKTPDLILLDVMMPGISGFETCRRLKENSATSQIPVVFLTGTADEAAIEQGLEMGGESYIIKPFHSVTFTAQVGEILARRKTSE